MNIHMCIRDIKSKPSFVDVMAVATFVIGCSTITALVVLIIFY